jgi:hypothetical protein
MATFNFPSSPTVGQIYTVGSKKWIWNGIAWTLPTISINGGGGDGGASVSIGTDAPFNPSIGDMWWDSDETSGGLYTYYMYIDNNQEYYQWIQVSSVKPSITLNTLIEDLLVDNGDSTTLSFTTILEGGNATSTFDTILNGGGS